MKTLRKRNLATSNSNQLEPAKIKTVLKNFIGPVSVGFTLYCVYVCILCIISDKCDNPGFKPG
jgi:hypothetical protein